MPDAPPSKASLLDLLRLLPRSRLLLLLALMLACGLSEGLGLILLVPWLHWMQTGNIPAGVPDWLPLHSMTIMLGGLLMLVTLRGLLLLWRNLLSAHLQHSLVDSLRERVFSALMSAEWRWLSTRRQSDHTNMITTDIQRIGIGGHFTLQLLTTVFMLASYVVVALLLSWPMTMLALASGAAAFMLLARQRQQAVSLGQQLGEATRSLHATVYDNLASLKLIKLLGSMAQQRIELNEDIATLRSKQIVFQRSNGLAQLLMQIIAAALLCIYIAIGLNWFKLFFTDLIVLVLIFARMTPMLGSLQQQLYGALHAMPALDSTLLLLRESTAAAEPAQPSTLTSAKMDNHIRLDNVSVHYPSREYPALDRVTLTLRARTTIALVGTSGAGKSTLADILSGLLQPDEGQVLLDGRQLTGECRMAWRSGIAYVPQEVILRNASIRSNLTWGLLDITDEQLYEALRRASANFVSELPKGLDTEIGDHGVRLSGGERQRLALARALLKRPTLLILDEATSALDHDNELRIRHAIEGLHGNLTLLIIGHRLALLEHADQVIVLQQGRVAASGVWQEVRHLVNMPS